jgi:hypothetical protein
VGQSAAEKGVANQQRGQGDEEGPAQPFAEGKQGYRGEAAQQRVKDVFSWTNRTCVLDGLYQQAMGKADRSVVQVTDPQPAGVLG